MTTSTNTTQVTAARHAWHNWKDNETISETAQTCKQQRYLEDIVQQAEDATNYNLTREIWNAVNRVSKYSAKSDMALKNNNGEWCLHADEELQTIKEHLMKDYNAAETKQTNPKQT
jgi:hypothetical protein